jgi:hypothetical protein
MARPAMSRASAMKASKPLRIADFLAGNRRDSTLALTASSFVPGSVREE